MEGYIWYYFTQGPEHLWTLNFIYFVYTGLCGGELHHMCGGQCHTSHFHVLGFELSSSCWNSSLFNY